jgi:hypothetical protein
MSNEVTYAWPGIGGIAGQCVICGQNFMTELVLGKSIATVKCDNTPMPAHIACRDKSFVDGKLVVENMPEGALKRSLMALP